MFGEYMLSCIRSPGMDSEKRATLAKALRQMRQRSLRAAAE